MTRSHLKRNKVMRRIVKLEKYLDELNIEMTAVVFSSFVFFKNL
jgi:hypothetical protein